MTSPADETRASLIVVSDVLTGEEVGDRLGVQPTKIVAKGSPTGQSAIPEHPVHIAMFTSGLDTWEELERHIETLVSFCEDHKDTLNELAKNCRMTIHCSYRVDTQGGWRVSPGLCQRMSLVPVDFVFNVEKK